MFGKLWKADGCNCYETTMNNDRSQASIRVHFHFLNIAKWQKICFCEVKVTFFSKSRENGFEVFQVDNLVWAVINVLSDIPLSSGSPHAKFKVDLQFETIPITNFGSINRKQAIKFFFKLSTFTFKYRVLFIQSS